jgi:hypothetical protein
MGRGALAVVLGVTTYLFLSAAAVGGLLGTDIQTISQQQAGGEDALDLLLGGRPEWTATWSLMQHQPFGYGPGAVPTTDDLIAAKEGLTVTTLGLGGNYVNEYMFGGGFKLHSVIADFWLNFGIPGLLWTLLLAVYFVVALLRRHPVSYDRAVVSFAAVTALWFLFFGPILSNLPDVIFLLAVVAQPVVSQQRDVASRGQSSAGRDFARDFV